MPTTESSNYPHVRITPTTHDKLRLVCFIERKTQGELVDELLTLRLARMGNPTIQVPRRQREPVRRGEPEKTVKPTRKAVPSRQRAGK